MRYASRIAISLLLVLIAFPGLMWGQGATVGTVLGQVTDPSGAVVPGAQVTLTDVSTRSSYGQPTNGAGRFVFADVKPGVYDVTVTAKGFRKLTVPSQTVLVGQSVTLNLTLEVGSATQTVEVTAVPGAELQTLNSTMGTTLSGDILLSLPNQNRDATSLLIFQPMTAPTYGGTEGNVTGGQVAGAMSDQNTFTLDGGNATDDLAGDNGYVSGNRGYVGPQAAIPTPVESIEEFQVATNNQTADFSSSAGGQVMLVTKRGTNTYHGSAYDYFQANWLDAAGWGTNSVYGSHITPVKQHQNRFGGAFGGPIAPSKWGGKTYFYGNYEGRRYPYANARYERQVPSATLREGIFEGRDTSNNVIQYNFETSTACGTSGTLPCDPRGPAAYAYNTANPGTYPNATATSALSPAIVKMWNQYMPQPNDCASYGDHLNTCGYFAALKLPIRDDFMVARVDHDFGAKWRAYASMRWFSLLYPSTNQIDIGGILPGDTLGVPAAQSSNPGNPRYYVVGLTGTLTPAVTNEFHVSYLRNDWNWIRAGVPLNFSLTLDPNCTGCGGFEVGGETTNPMAPMNMDTQNARRRLWDGQDFTYADTVSWLKGNHYLQFGGQFLHWFDIHARPDNVTSSLTQLVYQITSGNQLWTPDYYPMQCSGPNQTGCLSSTWRGAFEGDFAEMAGIVSQAEQLFVRGGSNFALTGATILEDHSITLQYHLFTNDSWKIRPNLTLNYGFEWSTAMPPYEKNGVQDILTDATGQAASYDSIINNMKTAALQGGVYNPVIGYTPILGMGTKQKYPYSPFYGAFSPRVSLAYSPAVKSDNWLGKILGNKKTVLRGGYVRIYDRTNAVNNVLTPLLGYGFGQPIRSVGMMSNGTFTGVTNSTNTSNAFRIGLDSGGGAAPFPVPSPTLPVPAEPGINSPGASALFGLDPAYRPGSDDQIDFSIQRELPGNMILEVGYNGRWAKHLYLGMNTDNVPVMMTLGGQTFTQAFYNLYRADQPVVIGKAAGAIAAQPFFETALGGPTSAFCKGYANCTTAVLANEGWNGTGNISYLSPYWLFSDFDTNAYGIGTTASLWNFNGCVGCQILPSSLQHYAFLNDATTDGFSNYQALVATLQKRTGHGLTLSYNFTYSHTLDTDGINQEYVEDAPNFPWNLHYDYAPAPWDRTLVMNLLANYELPFGKGKYFGTKNPVLDRIIGGWTISPVFTWSTGTPIEMYTGSCDEFGQGQIPWCAGVVPLVNTNTWGRTHILNAHTSGQTTTYDGPAFGSYVGSSNDPYADCGGQVCTADSYGINIFKNPAATFNSMRPDILGLDTTTEDNGPFYGQHRWNLDFTLAKRTHIKEKWDTTFYAQFLNGLNHTMFGDPYLSFLDPGDWGASYGQYGPARVIELGLRVAF